jgi:hypothetical protein
MADSKGSNKFNHRCIDRDRAHERLSGCFGLYLFSILRPHPWFLIISGTIDTGNWYITVYYEVQD